MKDQKLHAPSGLAVMYLSWFYCGKFPFAPGTIGSVGAIPFILLLHYFQINIYSLIAFIIILWILAVVTTEMIQKKFGLHDPQWIVIDEVIGMLITWSFVMKIDPLTLVLVFGSFRFFDIFKIWPATYFDRLHHGIGTITDDVISGLYAGIFTLFVLRFV